jgi:hypothetical protein
VPHGTRRIRVVVTVAAAALLLPAGVVASAVISPAPSAVLWEADPSKGLDVFQSLERSPGTISVADDPKKTYGRSYLYETWDHGSKERCESKGHRLPDGSVLTYARPGETYYVGWRSLWNPMPIKRGRWIAFWQLHHYGAGPGGGPLALRTLGDGKLHLQYTPPNGSDLHIWSTTLSLNEWNSFVVGFRVSRSPSDGWIEFWYNGVQQRLINGSTRYPAAVLKPGADYVTDKWGVYRSHPVDGRARAYLNHARVATSYAEAAP